MPDHHSSTLWSTADRARHFIVPDDAELPPGSFLLRTATGSERSVGKDSVAAFEVSESEAKAWAQQQLSATFGEFRERAEAFVDRLKARTAEMREENRRTWEKGIADAPPELRDAAERIRSGLRDLGQALQRVARENSEPSGAGEPSQPDAEEPADAADADARPPEKPDSPA